jgi:glycosyl hydrolase family 26
MILRWLCITAFWLCPLSLSPSANAAGLGAYVGNDPTRLAQFETWLGRPVDHISAHAGRASWSDWIGSIKWLTGVWQPLNKPIFWTIPLFANGGNLAEAASGAYNPHYRDAARALASSRPQDAVIRVRIGEEFNGNWMPWAAAGHEQEFIAAYRQFVDTFRAVSDRFRFEWNLNVGGTEMDPAKAYPGDQYVDVIGMDFYYDTAWDSRDAVIAWNHMVSRPFGLKWLEDFAAAHKRPTAYPEWGVNSDTAGPYIQNAAAWFASHNVLYQNYWNSDAEFTGSLSDGRYPGAAAAYIASFGPKAR